MKKFVLIFLILLSNFAIADYWGDYTFYSTKNSLKAYLIDKNSTTFHTWTFGSNKPTAYSAYVLPGGTVCRTYAATTVLKGGGISGGFQKVDWKDNVLWDFTYTSSSYCLHHDFCVLPNGNVLFISYDVRSATEATQAGCKSAISLWSEKIIEVKQTGPTSGEIVWEWKLWDHLCQNNNSSKSNYVTTISDHPELYNINFNVTQDFFHMNGIDYNEELDQIVFSSHFVNELYIIDHSTTISEASGHSGGKSGKGGDFLYRWGNPATYGVTGTRNFNVVHDAHWVPEGCPNANSLVGFNNKGGTGSKSCVDIFYPPYNGFNYIKNANSAYLPLTYDSRYTFSGNATQNEGNSQQLPNGNVLMNVAMTGYIVEFDSNKTQVWTKTISGSSAHVYRYTKCYIAGTIAPAPLVTKDGSNLVSSEGSSYQWFFNGEPIVGATNKIFSPNKNGFYRVQIVNSDGCESYLSEKIQINSFTGIVENITNSIISTNIMSDFIKINFDNFENINSIKIFDLYGNEMEIQLTENIIDVTNFQNGVYLLCIDTIDKSYITKVIVIK